MSSFVELRNVKKVYQMGEVEIAAANGIDFYVEKGEFAVIVGASDSFEHSWRNGYGNKRYGGCGWR